jgi:hypothetical protein
MNSVSKTKILILLGALTARHVRFKGNKDRLVHRRHGLWLSAIILGAYLSRVCIQISQLSDINFGHPHIGEYGWFADRARSVRRLNRSVQEAAQHRTDSARDAPRRRAEWRTFPRTENAKLWIHARDPIANALHLYRSCYTIGSVGRSSARRHICRGG